MTFTDRGKDWFANMGMRGKLILIFVLIKVIPLLLLGLFAWEAAQRLGEAVTAHAVRMADQMRETQQRTGKTATDDAIRALDERSREAIEAQTTETARAVAEFLYERDADLRRAARLTPSESSYREFVATHVRQLPEHGRYAPTADGKGWTLAQPSPPATPPEVTPLPDNAKGFHLRPPEMLGERRFQPLYLEMTFVDVNGQEKVRVVDGRVMTPGLRDVSRRENTYARAETYFSELKKLKPGDIYVSSVIGPQVRTHWIGPYTLAKAKELGKPFAPEQSGYAGLENPVGQRFQGIVRWAMPVTEQGRITGYVTLALDHRHLMAFTDNLRPTTERYAPIADPASGNYAFMWDPLGRSISHPRDYFIVGYDPKTGEQAAPWLDTELWQEWQASGKPWHEFARSIPPFRDQKLTRKPAPESSKSGQVGLDCRYLNFSPQCHGWLQVTEGGGSGSFTIFFSGLWKLTTAAAIPYYTGQYGQTPRGFGFVTIGANVDDFHRAATESGQRISALIAASDAQLEQNRLALVDAIHHQLGNTAILLSASTLFMAILVIAIAIWMASVLTRRITGMIQGIRAFEGGHLDARLPVQGQDEMAQLSSSFNRMADSVARTFQQEEQARIAAEQAQEAAEKARVAAEKANATKTQFLQAMSHELRTPLNGILGFAEVLELDVTDDGQRECVDHIRSSGQRLLGLVNHVLDLAMVEAGEIELTPDAVHVADLLTSVSAHHQRQAAGKSLTLHCCPVPADAGWVQADLQRLQQVLEIVVDNAIKFTCTGSITLSARRDGDRIAIAVQDTGIGIDPADQERIFERFQQVDQSATRCHEGAGIGLALARPLLQLMAGDISVTSARGAGSTFTIHLPVAEPPLAIDV